MKNNIKKWIGKQAAALSLAMGNAQVNITEQYDDAKTIGMVQKKRQGSLMDDLLEGKLTDEVKAYRSRFWYVLSQTGTSILEKVNSDGTIKIVGEDKPKEFKFGIKNDSINNQHSGLIENSTNIKVDYDFTPIYDIHQYIKRVSVLGLGNNIYSIILTVNLIEGDIEMKDMYSGINKLDVMWSKHIKKITKDKTYNSPVLDIQTLHLTTDENKEFPGNITFSFHNLEVKDMILNNGDINIYYKGELKEYINPFNDYVLNKTEEAYQDQAPREQRYLKSGK
jgi:hypothetical protein